MAGAAGAKAVPARFACDAGADYLVRVGFRTQWRGQRDTTSSRRFWKLLVLSLMLHAPLTPLAALVGLIGLLARRPAGDVPASHEKITAIPVELLEDEGSGPAGARSDAPKPSPKAAKVAPPAPKPGHAGTTQLVTGERDAGAPRPGARDGGTRGSDAGKARAGSGSSVGDPVALAGSAGRVADSHANVRLIIYNDRIRSHPLGARIGKLLGQVDQWHDFFGPAGLDPIKDFDRILIAGPQLRDSSNVVAVLRYNVSRQRMKRALDALVARDSAQGGWLDAGVPAARARGDRAERIFVLPAPHILVVTPPSAEKSALSLSPHTRFPAAKGSVALSVYVNTPWRALIGINFNVPRSIAWVRMDITATPDGGATANVVAMDASPAAAKRDADNLTTAINAVTQVNLGILGSILGHKQFKLIEPVSLSAHGKRIEGTVRATPKELGALLEAVWAKAQQIAQDNARAAARSSADAGAPAPTAPAPSGPVPSAAASASGASPAPAPTAPGSAATPPPASAPAPAQPEPPGAADAG